MIGKKISHYNVTAKLGQGGMGEVYRATDTRLGRDVALKTLPEAFAADAERMARFEREAQLLASLNHPYIASIYGLEEADGIRCLVLELVEGETLAERIKKGPLPLDEALPIARQIAEALEAAHERGVVHRDLKPANVKITPDGTVKVLDFGLAKAFAGEEDKEDPAKSPTLTAMATQAGIILGTAAYMSPEQAKGKAVDRRADIWSFGVVLYEMLSGKQGFGGETISETLAEVMLKQVDWEALPADTPTPVRKLLRRCLEKDPRRRLRDIGEARFALEEFQADSAASVLTSAPGLAVPQPAWQRLLPWVAAGVLAVALALALWAPWRSAPLPAPTFRLNASLVPGADLYTDIGPPVVISPDGSRLAYVTAQPRQLYVRSVDKLEATALSGTEGAFNPFFSPDGQWVGFFAQGKLKKVSFTGGAPLTLADAPDGRGASWGDDGTIIFAPDATAGGPLLQVQAAGGTPKPITQLDKDTGEIIHRWPQILPGSKVFLYVATTKHRDYWNASIVAQSLVSGERKIVHQGGTFPCYLPSGHLVFVRERTLFAAPFDPAHLKLTGEPVPVLEGVFALPNTGGAHLSFSQNGTLFYLSGSQSAAKVSAVRVDRRGTAAPLITQPAEYADPSFSPDGSRLALDLESGTGESDTDIWVYDIARGNMTRLTFTADGNSYPIWSPDGRRVAYSSSAGGGYKMFWKLADGTGDAKPILEGDQSRVASSISPDGKVLAFFQESSASSWDLWTMPWESAEADNQQAPKPQLFLGTKYAEYYPRFSPDGRWLAYVSEESGRSEIYVRPFPSAEGKWQVSTQGGDFPLWSPKPRELFYLEGKKLMVASYSAEGGSFRAGKPQMLFAGDDFASRGIAYPYGVAPDGSHFVMFKSKEGEEAPPAQPTFVFNWFDEVRRLVPTGKN